MKRIAAGIFGVFLMLVCAGSIFAMETGRYQLFQAKYQQSDLNSSNSTEMNELFMLDTATGELQVYSATTKDGKQARAWGPAIYDQITKP